MKKKQQHDDVIVIDVKSVEKARTSTSVSAEFHTNKSSYDQASDEHSYKGSLLYKSAKFEQDQHLGNGGGNTTSNTTFTFTLRVNVYVYAFDWWFGGNTLVIIHFTLLFCSSVIVSKSTVIFISSSIISFDFQHLLSAFFISKAKCLRKREKLQRDYITCVY